MTLIDCPPDSPIHCCSWAGQPDIYIACVRLWTQPFWWSERLPALPEKVYRAADEDVHRVWGFYTFLEEQVTCPECLCLIAAGQTRPEEATPAPAETPPGGAL